MSQTRSRISYAFFASGSFRRNPSLLRALCLGRELLDRGVEVYYVADDIADNRAPEVFDHRARIAYVNPCRGLQQFTARRAAIANLSPSYVHVINVAPKTFAGLVRSRWKLIADYDERPACRPHSFWRKQRECAFEAWVNRRAVHVIVCSRHLQREWSALYGRTPTYLPYAIDSVERQPVPSPFSEPTAVYVGTFSKPYDLDLLFHAAKLLADRNVWPRICLVGRGPEWQMWSDFVKANGLSNVELPGFLDDAEMQRRVAHAHVLLFPIRPSPPNLSRCPYKTYMYAQARRPVIVNRTGEIPAVLGDLATYVDCTPESFAEAIQRAMQSPVLPDIDYGVERHNWGARADQLLELIS
jgi:glycosyltransferase involved in cell wall biosynthesis